MGVKIFSSVNVDSPHFFNEMEGELKKVMLQFSLRWNSGKNIVLFNLSAGIENQSMQNLLSHPIGENDGEITASLGSFSKGTKLEIQYEIFAIDDIEKIAIFVIENNETLFKLSPLPPEPEFKSLKSREALNESKKYTIIGTDKKEIQK
jgi:hypothetical protein